MKLTLQGHQDQYAVEQLQMALFSTQSEGEALSTLHRGNTWLTATAQITINGKTTRASRRLKAGEETVRLRRRILQQSYYLAALPHLSQAPAWGALAGVRPTKIPTKHLLEGGTASSADKLLKDIYFVTPPRRELAKHGISCEGHAARQVTMKDYHYFDRIYYMDSRNLRYLRQMFPKETKFRPLLSRDVADPYYSGDFTQTWQDIYEGCQNILEELL